MYKKNAVSGASGTPCYLLLLIIITTRTHVLLEYCWSERRQIAQLGGRSAEGIDRASDSLRNCRWLKVLAGRTGHYGVNLGGELEPFDEHLALAAQEQVDRTA